MVFGVVQVSLLLDMGAEPHQAAFVHGHSVEVSPLILACVRGKAAIADRLLALDVDINAPDLSGRTALMYGARNGMVCDAVPDLTHLETSRAPCSCPVPNVIPSQSLDANFSG